MRALRPLLFVFALLLAPVSGLQAQGAVDPDIAHRDFSVADAQGFFTTEFGDPLTSIFLNELFGPLFPTVDRDRDSTHATVFSRIIGYINIVAIGLGGLLFAWNATSGLLQTAHEGELLGRRWSSLWAPMRIVFAVGLLVPLPGLHGYNAAQAAVAYIVRGATMSASFIWEVAAEAILVDQVPIAASPPTLPGDMVRNMYGISVCRVIVEHQLKANKDYGGSYSVYPHKIVNEEGPGRTKEAVVLLMTMSNGQRIPVCGRWETPPYDERIVTFLAESGIVDDKMDTVLREFKEGHYIIMAKLHHAMMVIARDKAGVILTERRGTDPVPRHERAFADAVLEANTGLSSLAKKIFERVGTYKSEDGVLRGELLLKAVTGGDLCKGDKAALMRDRNQRQYCYGEGWIGAGKWYLTLARINNSLNVFGSTFGAVHEDGVFSTESPPRIIANREEGRSAFWGLLEWSVTVKENVGNYLDMRSAITAWKGFIHAYDRDRLGLAALGRGFGVDPHQLAVTTDPEGDYGSWATKAIIEKPVRDAVEWLTGQVVGQDPILSLMTWGDRMLTIAGILTVALSTALTGGGGAAAGLLTMLWGAGALLQIILPMMPWILWVVAVTGYFLLIVEAVVGVSFWAFAHLRMDGEGISGAATNGWTMLLALLLTPILMMIGYLVGMGIFRVTSSLLTAGIYPTFHAALVNSTIITALVSLPAVALLIGVMQLVLIERSFSLITEFPNRVLNWIGGRADLADQGALDRARIGMIGATAGVGSGGSALAQSGGSGVRGLIDRARGGDRGRGRAQIGSDKSRPTGD